MHHRENSCVLDLECLGRRDCRKCALIHDPAAVQGVRDLANARAIVNNKGPAGRRLLESSAAAGMR